MRINLPFLKSTTWLNDPSAWTPLCSVAEHAQAPEGQDPVSEVANLRELNDHAREVLVRVSEHFADALLAPIDLGPHTHQRRVPLDIWIQLVEQRVQIAAVGGIDRPLVYVDVLLHIARAVSRGLGEGAEGELPAQKTAA